MTGLSIGLPQKQDNPNLIPGDFMKVKDRTNSTKLFVALHMCDMAYTHPHKHIIHNNNNSLKVTKRDIIITSVICVTQTTKAKALCFPQVSACSNTHQLSELHYYSVTRALTINYVLEIIWE